MHSSFRSWYVLIPCSHLRPLLTHRAGGCAGTSTDLAFFPIDTVKTRLQARGGFFVNGGWHGIYKGLSTALVALAPSASLFFITYDGLKAATKESLPLPVSHMVSAMAGEVAGWLVRVPAEVIKQRTQAGVIGVSGKSTSWANLQYLLQNKSGEGVIRGLYRGWNTTIMREIPFTVIQFPLYEKLKLLWSTYDNAEISLFKGAINGSIAGGIAAAITTPLDVVKTRVMLHSDRVNVSTLVKQMLAEEGMGVFWKGVGARTSWVSAGGAIFLGCYELVHTNLLSAMKAKALE